MRKSSLVLLLAMAFVLTTVVSGFSSTIVDGPCTEVCEKCWGYNLFIDTTYGCDAITQANPSATCDDCPTFDYESSLGYCMTNGEWASLLDGNDVSCTKGAYANAAGIILKVCECLDLPEGEFSTQKSYGIKIEIVTPASGVYFTDVNTSATALLPTCQADTTCSGDSNIYVASLGDTTNEAKFCPDCTDATVFEMAYEAISGDLFTDSMQPDVGDECCLDCVDNLATAVQTTCDRPFMFAQSPYIMVDIPTMVWDPKKITDGDIVTIKVTITGEKGDEICTDCTDLCSCIVQVGIFGCPETLDECEFCLPYFTATDSGWWSGFALTNAGPNAADVTVSFYAGGEKVAVEVVVPAQSVAVKALSEFDLSAFAGDDAIYANVKAVSAIDEEAGAEVSGFAIMGDSTQAYGYLSKPGLCGCESCIKVEIE